MTDGNIRASFIELFIIPVAATTGKSDNDRVWYNAASWYAFLFQTRIDNFIKTGVQDSVSHSMSAFYSESDALTKYREADINMWHGNYGGKPTSLPSGLANNSSIWSKYVISGNGNKTNFSDNRNLRYTAFATSQIKSSSGKVLNSNSGFTFISAGSLVDPPPATAKPCGGIAMTREKPKDDNTSVKKFDDKRTKEEVSAQLKLSFAVSDDSLRNEFYKYFTEKDTFKNVSVKINLNLSLEEKEKGKKSASNKIVVDQALKIDGLTVVKKKVSDKESSIEISGIKDKAILEKILKGTTTLKLVDEKITLSEDTMKVKGSGAKKSLSLYNIYTAKGTISVTYTKGGKTETYITGLTKDGKSGKGGINKEEVKQDSR